MFYASPYNAGCFHPFTLIAYGQVLPRFTELGPNNRRFNILTTASTAVNKNNKNRPSLTRIPIRCDAYVRQYVVQIQGARHFASAQRVRILISVVYVALNRISLLASLCLISEMHLRRL